MTEVADLIFLPLTVPTYHYRQDGIMATWGKRIQHLDWLDWTNGLPHVSIDLVGYISGQSDKQITLGHKWYVFCDDDTYIFVDRLVDLLEKHDHEQRLCIGAIINCLAGHPNFYYPSGVCFVLSSAAIQALREYFIATPDPPRHNIHDASMGVWCEAVNIQLVNVDGMYGTSHIALGHQPETIKQAIAYNHIGPESMPELEGYEST